MHMKDWTEKLNAFLQFNDRDILENSGKVSRAVAEKLLWMNTLNLACAESTKPMNGLGY